MLKISKIETVMGILGLSVFVGAFLAPEKYMAFASITIPFLLLIVFLALGTRIRAAARKGQESGKGFEKTMSVDEIGLLLPTGKEMRKMAREVIQHRERLGINHLLAAGGSKGLLGYSDITPILEAYGKKGMLGALKNWTLTQRGEWEDLSSYERILSLDEWTAAGNPGFKPKNPMLVV